MKSVVRINSHTKYPDYNLKTSNLLSSTSYNKIDPTRTLMTIFYLLSLYFMFLYSFIRKYNTSLRDLHL